MKASITALDSYAGAMGAEELVGPVRALAQLLEPRTSTVSECREDDNAPEPLSKELFELIQQAFTRNPAMMHWADVIMPPPPRTA